MVGIVIVSHSEKIAQGIVDLCSQMAQEVMIEPAGGTEDGSIGTDAVKIMKAIKKVYNKDGVLVLADLGSAIMSTEVALDLLDEKVKEKVAIADAPIVEGSVVAAIEAAVGNGLEAVKIACEESRYLKKIQ